VSLGNFSEASEKSMCPGSTEPLRNEFQVNPGCKGGRCVGLSVPIVYKSRSLYLYILITSPLLLLKFSSCVRGVLGYSLNFISKHHPKGMRAFPWFLQKDVGIEQLYIRNYTLHRTCLRMI
jgi:hypothetical protein